MDKSLKFIQKLTDIIFGVNFHDSSKPQLNPFKPAFNGIIYVFFIFTLFLTLAFHSTNMVFLDKIFLICGLFGISNGLFLFVDFYSKREKYHEMIKWINDWFVLHLSMTEEEKVRRFQERSKRISMIIL